MISFVVGAVVGGALLGLAWMLLTTPAVFAYHSANGQERTARRNTREAWAVAYGLGVASYVLLILSGTITY